MPKIREELGGEKQSSSPSPICSLVSLENVELELAFGENGSMSCFARCALLSLVSQNLVCQKSSLVHAPIRVAPLDSNRPHVRWEANGESCAETALRRRDDVDVDVY